MQRLLYLLLFLPLATSATKISGTIKTIAGEPLGYASVIVKGETNGTMANGLGEYALSLEANKTYTLSFQFMGYKSQLKTVELKENDINLNIVLEEQVISLKPLAIGNNEDPANSVMRKAIAKSLIHFKQVDAFDADAYIKNTVTINKLPKLFRKQAAEVGIKVGVPFVSEALVNVKFTQPNKRVIKVLAKKKSIDAIDVSGDYYMINFYKPNQSETVSPLSSKAFSYYRFEYLGYFEEEGRTINKIRIIPKTYGPGVLKGTINIIEDLWCIHSIDVETKLQGFTIKTKQSYAPKQQVWVPVSQNIDFSGGLLGLNFIAKLNLHPKYKNLKINTKYVAEVNIDDSKDAPPPRKTSEISLGEKELTLKELNRLAKQMEKDAKRTPKEERVIREDSVTTDSLASKRSIEYWNEVRSIPLNIEEKEGYKMGDSISVKIAAKNDSTKKKDKPLDKLFGLQNKKLQDNEQYKLNLEYLFPIIPFKAVNYNIVEGIFTEARLNINKTAKENDFKDWTYHINNNFKYAFGIKRFMFSTDMKFTKYRNNIFIGGGSRSQTFDKMQEIPAWVNSAVNFFNINLMQIYLNQGVNVGYQYKIDNLFLVGSNFELANRKGMDVLGNPPLQIGNREPTANYPENFELGDTRFPNHTALVWNSVLKYTPGARYSLYNGRKRFQSGQWPEMTLNYKKGFHDVNYDFLSFSLSQSLKSGPNERFKYHAEVGGFLNDKKFYLMDMKHINSINLLNFSSFGNFAFYRILNTDLPFQITANNYYRYSTSGNYMKAHAINEFRKLLVTQIPLARFTGLKEDIFVNYLYTPQKKNYLEIGYGIDGIVKLFRIEIITSLQKGKSAGWGFQIGVNL